MSEVRHSRRALAFVTLSLAGVAAGLPILRLRAALHDAHPVGDYPIFEVNVRMALAGVQRLGPYSQGFRHPGPAYFYWLAVPYALSGGTMSPSRDASRAWITGKTMRVVGAVTTPRRRRRDGHRRPPSPFDGSAAPCFLDYGSRTNTK